MVIHVTLGRNKLDTMTAEMQGGFTIDDIQITNHIARGENSMILEAKWEGLRVAIKDLNFIVDQGRVQVSGKELQRLREHLINECRLNSYIRHPNMVRFLGIHSPLGTKIPYIVMERLNCNLNDFLLQYSIVPLEIKLHILHGIGLGLRYLHARDPPIIHKDLTSKNILLSNGIEVKISNLCTAQLIPSSLNVWKNHSVDFLPSLDDPLKMTKEVDVFSFGCVMIHTFCHQWPTPSPAVVSSNDPNEEQAMADSSSELDRRSQYLDKVPKSVEEVVIPLIASCLEDLPNDRPTAREVCDQLETLVVNRKCTLPDNLLEAQMVLEKAQEQIKCQTAELQLIKSELVTKKTNLQEQSIEVKSLRLELSKLQVSSSHQFGNLQVTIS